MNTFIIILCIAAAIFAAIFPVQLRIRRNMRRYWDRACTGVQWRRRFPDAPKSEIRSFLDLFVEAFAFRQSQRLCFAPDDKVMDVYHTLYPEKFMADALELETLAMRLSERYGIDAGGLWREDITLGELFTHTRVV
jgi:hypothetical protein